MLRSSYTVERHDHGLLIRGPIPVDHLAGLTKIAKVAGFPLLDAGVGQVLGGLALTNKKDGDAWRLEIEELNKQTSHGDAELEWLLGTDTGVSSMTIFSVLSERYQAEAKEKYKRADTPHDPDDFGRCYRLLERFPAWRKRLGEVAAEHPAWARLVEHWDKMEALWREELPKKSCPKLYRLIQELRTQ